MPRLSARKESANRVRSGSGGAVVEGEPVVGVGLDLIFVEFGDGAGSEEPAVEGGVRVADAAGGDEDRDQRVAADEGFDELGDVAAEVGFDEFVEAIQDHDGAAVVEEVLDGVGGWGEVVGGGGDLFEVVGEGFAARAEGGGEVAQYQ
jgi:hypothetical protein